MEIFAGSVKIPGKFEKTACLTQFFTSGRGIYSNILFLKAALNGRNTQYYYNKCLCQMSKRGIFSQFH